ncbi:hypothetical protein GCM10009555_072630 [Acrocarpospora macrocephala]|uniref:Uncharacterized protein n=1 Tax=Acrocarpospora macrocephala TaxID=150177 RepID=A0A5M3WJM8_9ACTN|nr:hypothetical protein [Acrocarpospora macrocephala]GES08590.1 hypothetical protein Amac_021860 [Acrocarpospora macrocephala]
MSEHADDIDPKDFPADLLDAVYLRVLANGIPWHPDAVRILAAALLTEARERIAQAVEEACIDPDWPSDDVSSNGALAVAVVRGWPDTNPNSESEATPR